MFFSKLENIDISKMALQKSHRIDLTVLLKINNNDNNNDNNMKQ